MNQLPLFKARNDVRFLPAAFILTALAAIAISCSGEKTPPPEKKTAEKMSALSEKAQWADMLLRPTDSTRRNWVSEMAGWPDPLVISLDSSGRAQISDLTFALDIWAFKNLDLAGDSAASGLRVEIAIAATHIPDYLLIKDFLIDSVQFFLPGQDAPAASRTIMAARRKFLQGVWQVQFIHADAPTARLDFPEKTRLVPKVFASWRGKKIIFAAPPIMYEYTRSPRPITG